MLILNRRKGGFGKRNKMKLIICSMIFTAGGFINIFFHRCPYVTIGDDYIEVLPINECLKSIFISRQHLMLFLCLQGFALVMACNVFLHKFTAIPIRFSRITPDIKPQYQSDNISMGPQGG